MTYQPSSTAVKFEPSEAMRKAVILRALELRPMFPPRTNGEMVDVAINALATHLADPVNAQDAKAWAEATMDPVTKERPIIVSYDPEDDSTVIIGIDGLYRVREAQ